MQWIDSAFLKLYIFNCKIREESEENAILVSTQTDERYLNLYSNAARDSIAFYEKIKVENLQHFAVVERDAFS